MRQIYKDRIARIEAEIAELQELFKIYYAREQEAETQGRKLFFGAANSSKAVQERVQQLLDKREQVANKAIFGTVKQSKFKQVLADRQFNYENALEDKHAIWEDLAFALANGNESEVNRLKTKLGNMNRTISIYKRALDYWKDKERSVIIVPDYKPADRRTEIEIQTVNRPVDEEVLAIIQGKNKKPENNATRDLLMRPEEKEQELVEENPFLLTEPYKKPII